jgi:hypothetical protein
LPSGSFPSILAGSTITAALLSSMLPQFAWKTADTSRATTTVLANDPDLVLPMAASASYLFLVSLDYEGAAVGTGDIKWHFTGPTGFTMRYHRWHVDTSGAASVGGLASESGTPTAGSAGAASLKGITMAGTVFNGSSSGNLTFQWAQNTSSGTATIVHAQSVMALLRMA